MTQTQISCLHPTLERLADTIRTSFPSFKAGFRYWKCETCGLILKAIPEQLKVVTTQFISNPFQVLGVSDPAPAPPAPAPPAPPAKEHLSFLHHLGTFLLDSVLPVALQIVVPILERK